MQTVFFLDHYCRLRAKKLINKIYKDVVSLICKLFDMIDRGDI